MRGLGRILGLILSSTMGLAAQPLSTSVYIGCNVCRTCHPDIWATFYKNPHYKSPASGKEPPERSGCESCHGPGKAHIEARGGKATIVAFSELPSAAVLDNCLRCHAQTLSRANIRRSSHTLACANCHSVHKYFSAAGRFTYTAGQRGFVLDETALGTACSGAALDRQIPTAGNAQRPVLTADVTLSFLPTSRLSVVNHTAGNDVRIDGNSIYAELDDATKILSYLAFEFSGIRRITNDTNIDFRATRWIGFFGGYQYPDRQIRSIQQNVFQVKVFNATFEQTNILHAGTFGLRLQLIKSWSILLDGEIGRSNYPLTPIAERNYHTLDARGPYQVKTFLLTASTQANYNTNSVMLSTYASHARNYGARAAWTPRDWFALDAGYSKLHLNTAGRIAYFANSQFITGQQSIYLSNLHLANLTAHFDFGKRADLLVGYSHSQDTGDGRSTAAGEGIGSPLPAFQVVQTFPLTFRSLMARLSVRNGGKIRWNLGDQYYGYNERFLMGDDYRAHTGYSSVLWSF